MRNRILKERIAMANKRSKQKKTKQNKISGQKGGSMSFDELSSTQPKKKKNKKQ